ncbi:MAG TPA: amidohydrolase [Bryobacteraceae bacterium]|nr:amidohydrolase [Bryobacteraceae bacterium]HPT24876.1 amidohydrolase [Bryobacteraceae bacterium]
MKLLVLVLAAGLSALAADNPIQRVDAHAARFGRVSRQIWENPELGFGESKSAALLASELRASGFRVSEGVAGLPTAFTAEWGEGKPVIAILGEYDALPGLSQNDVPERSPRVAGDPGHGCGHNLFGAASALAAVAVKEEMQAGGLKGTVRFYGTPAEEGGGGKIFMIRAGLFRDVDTVLAWHPADFNSADANSWLANISARITFTGRPAHAAAAPDAGRSALDAVELTLHAVNMLREHVPQETRLHYVIAKGGAAANIVPDLAEISLIARHPDLKTLEAIWQRVRKCAEAGALATETAVDIRVTSSYANLLPVPALVALIDRSLKSAGGVTYDDAERAFATRLRTTLDNPRPIEEAASIRAPRTLLLSASSDVGDVSWSVPTGHLYAATFFPGVPFHTWQSTACAGTSAGRKGMTVAAKAIALSAVELLRNPGLLTEVQTQYRQAMHGKTYRSLLPADARPGSR